MTRSAVPIGTSGGRADGRGPGACRGSVTRSCRPWRNSSICRAASPLVTGAGSGLGAVFAEALAEAGASVVCVGRRLERVQETAHRLASDRLPEPGHLGRRHR